MKKVFKSFSLAFLFSIISLVGLAITAQAEENSTDQTPSVQYYDANGNPIYPYSEEELKWQLNGESKKILEHSKSNEMKLSGTNNFQAAAEEYGLYEYGKTSFRSYVWVANQRTFYNPSVIDAELVTRATNISIRAYSSTGTYLGKAVFKNKAGWISANWNHLPSQYVKFRFYNDEGNNEYNEIKWGNIWYG